MLRFVATLSFVVLVGLSSGTMAEPVGASQAEQTTATHGPLIVPSGTQVPLTVIRPVRMESAKAQDALYAQTSYPVAIGGRMAIPAGTFVQGRIVSLTRPTRKVSESSLRVQFTKLVFANGYTVPLGDGLVGADVMYVTVNVSTANDLLLDNGAQMDLTLTSPVTLSGKNVRAAIPLSKAPKPGSLASATMCRPTPATPGTPGMPGTPDTVIPGTPDTTIPGPDGTSTTIPGTPATVIPGTPGTPGDPGSPGTVCPAKPRVLSSVPEAGVAAVSSQVQ